MTQKELKQRLTELLDDLNFVYGELIATCCENNSKYDVPFGEFFAENLITNGVTIQERGEWVHLGGDEWCCSVCGNVINTEGSWEKPTQKFCDECGAEIQGVKYKKNKSWIFASLDEIIDCF